MSETEIRLIVGLGNPGRTYQDTRHNVGFMVAEALAERYGVALKRSKFKARLGQGDIENRRVYLAMPLTFMNLSGTAVADIARYYGMSGKEILIIHDDVDLVFGRIKIKEKGGSGGHKGIKSLLSVFREGDFIRLRIGVGRPDAGMNTADYVLDAFTKAETLILHDVIDRAREAVGAILREGARSSMNEFNSRNMTISS